LIQVILHTSYLVGATRRSGSTFLCESFKKSEMAGDVRKYFLDYNMARYTEGWGVTDDADYMRAKTERPVTPNGALGAQITWPHPNSFDIDPLGDFATIMLHLQRQANTHSTARRSSSARGSRR
jgi:hypothetical protein